jgi:hypothetical protein
MDGVPELRRRDAIVLVVILMESRIADIPSDAPAFIFDNAAGDSCHLASARASAKNLDVLQG